VSAPAEPDPNARAAGRRWAWAAGALAGATLLGAADRPLLGALVGGIRADLWIDDVQLGSLAAAFALAQALALGAMPRLAARLGRVRVLPRGLALLGSATLLAAAAPFFAALLAARAAAGAAQAAPAALARPLLEDVELGRRRGRAAALAAAALPAGAALGYALAGAIGPWLGWRGALAAAGGLVLLLALGVLRLREPLPAAGALPPLAGPLPDAAGRPPVAGGVHALALCGHLLLAFALAGILFWAPAFLERARGVPPAVAAFQLAAIAVMAGLGAPVAARLLAAWPGRRLGAPEPWAAAIACLASAALAWTAIVYPGPEVYLAALTLALLLLFAALAPAAAAIARARGPVRPAAALAASCALVAGDAAAPVAVGVLSELWNLYWAFLAVPLAALAAALAFAAAGYAGRSRYRSASRPSP